MRATKLVFSIPSTATLAWSGPLLYPPPPNIAVAFVSQYSHGGKAFLPYSPGTGGGVLTNRTLFIARSRQVRGGSVHYMGAEAL